LRILVTAGPTREYIDPVRYISNDSSGKMGFAIAAEAARRGHRVTLVHGPVALPEPPGVVDRSVVSAAEMLRECRKEWPLQDILIMAAAVADYRPVRAAAAKIKKSAAAMTVALEPTEDILATLAAGRRADQFVIGFALEDRSPRRNAESKLRRKRLDAIVLNLPTAIAADRSGIDILRAGFGWTKSRQATKSAHAATIVSLAESLASGTAN
jgi:phosphopantothenoylcysteine decarboxylase/phosphopantothenate--cysteine ligase